MQDINRIEPSDPDSSASETILYLLRLYVCGQTTNSLSAIRNLSRLLEHHFPHRYRLEIVDVLRHPSLAEQEHVLVTPTLIRVQPLPPRRIIGDLGDRERVMAGLDPGT